MAKGIAICRIVLKKRQLLMLHENVTSVEGLVQHYVYACVPTHTRKHIDSHADF